MVWSDWTLSSIGLFRMFPVVQETDDEDCIGQYPRPPGHGWWRYVVTFRPYITWYRSITMYVRCMCCSYVIIFFIRIYCNLLICASFVSTDIYIRIEWRAVSSTSCRISLWPLKHIVSTYATVKLVYKWSIYRMLTNISNNIYIYIHLYRYHLYHVYHVYHLYNIYIWYMYNHWTI